MNEDYYADDVDIFKPPIRKHSEYTTNPTGDTVESELAPTLSEQTCSETTPTGDVLSGEVAPYLEMWNECANTIPEYDTANCETLNIDDLISPPDSLIAPMPNDFANDVDLFVPAIPTHPDCYNEQFPVQVANGLAPTPFEG